MATTMLFILLILLLLASLEAVKIGISPVSKVNASTSTTTTTTTTILPFISTIDIDLNVTEDITTEATFPPRKPQKVPTTTAKTTTTTTEVTATEAPPTIAITTIKNKSPPSYCSCNLRKGDCDLNCCCDYDCSPEAFTVFMCSPTAQKDLLLEDFQYTHGLPSCKVNDGWLCVFRTNTKPAKLRKLSDDTFNSADYNKWSDLLPGVYEQAEELPYYRSGQPLQLWNPETRNVITFELPGAFESAYCEITQPIRHLKPMSSSCLWNDADQVQRNLYELLNLTTSHRLLPTPYHRHMATTNDQTENRDGEDEVGIAIRVCYQLLNGTKKICLDNSTTTDTELSPIEDIPIVIVQLQHNYTHILDVLVLFKEEPPAITNNEREFWQHYEVQFTLVSSDNQTMELELKPTSGALGYQLGAPILMAKLIPENDTQVLSYYQAKTQSVSDHWLSLFTKRPLSTGVCMRSGDQRFAVEYGVDVTKKCSLHKELPKNVTEFCHQLQLEIWEQLLPNNCKNLSDLSMIFVSQLGNPQVDKWLPLQQLNNTSELPHVGGKYNEEQMLFTCHNVILNVRYEFHTASLTLLKGMAPHQRLIQHSALVLGPLHDLQFDAGEEQLEVPLGVSVMFYDAQRKRLNNSGVGLMTTTSLIISSIMVISRCLF